MLTLTATEARRRLYTLMDDVADSHEPLHITGKRGNSVLLAAEDWRAIQETLYLLAIPGMRRSIVRGLKTPISKCHEEPGW
jgi:antitoxin YefM